ncbi:hypothetical protein [Cupriavidus sp. UGS-1]|uniref:hypothetical protein n=1 Tax=Cupriavidus sp. UGS-1 TaxID=2899826 RepID=UPI001E3C8134|nr:hypothetical protein [Cupriavidus sp. UGS-1]MCD9122397.1 hypothetical protein [Cupriavidus sp. UGS-1]
MIPGMERAAATLETHRYAALKGGSLGFTKWAGTTINVAGQVGPYRNVPIESSMLKGSGGVRV